jgi:UDP-glucose 4-epimerase
MRALITGAAGFIGSNLADRLLSEGYEVVGFDNFSTGQVEFLKDAFVSPRFELKRGDLLRKEEITEAMQGCSVVYHLAANADVRFGTERPLRDMQQNTLGTVNVLAAMVECGVRRIAFSSTGSIYGEAQVIPTPEDVTIPRQTSLYGASKIAAEGFIDAFAEGYGISGCIFRFVSVLGERYSHGHIFDFCKQLLGDPEHLRVLGDGKQRKSYLYVGDCVEAMLTAMNQAAPGIQKFNLGTDEYCQVNDSIRWICGRLGVSPQISYTGGDRGWIGDNPFIFLDASRIKSLGWRAQFSIEAGVKRTIEYLLANRWIFSERTAEVPAS